MSKKDEALKLALEALEQIAAYRPLTFAECSDAEAVMRIAENAIPYLQEALAEQPAQQQEPVAYIRKDQLQKAAQSPMLCEVTPEPRQDRIGIHTSPPASKPWVGLTDEEKADLFEGTAPYYNELDYANAIEAKLKEKNT